MWFVVASLGLGCARSAVDVPMAQVEQRDFVQSVAAAGRLEAADSVEIRAQGMGSDVFITWIAEDGSRVEAGDRLLEYDRAALLRNIEESEAELDLTQTRLAQIDAKLSLQLEEAKKGVAKARMDLRLAEMRQTTSEAVPAIQRAQAAIDAKKARLAIETAEMKIRTLELDATADRRLLALQVAQRRRQLDELRQQLDNAVILAPSPGVVLKGRNWRGEPWQVGVPTYSGRLLFELPDTRKLVVSAAAHEVDAAQIEVGQPVGVRVDALPLLRLRGTVTAVGALASPDRRTGKRMVSMKVRLDDRPPALRPGLTVRADVEVQRVDAALQVPREAIWHDAEGSSHVWVRGLAGWSRRAVEVGGHNRTHALLRGGLQPGDWVALTDPSAAGRANALAAL